MEIEILSLPYLIQQSFFRAICHRQGAYTPCNLFIALDFAIISRFNKGLKSLVSHHIYIQIGFVFLFRKKSFKIKSVVGERSAD